MADFNIAVFTGNLGSDPSIKYFESGKCVSEFSLAVNEYAGKDKPEKTHWIDVETWGQNAVYVAEYAKRGSRLVVEGKFRTKTYKITEDKSVKKTYLVAETINVQKKDA